MESISIFDIFKIGVGPSSSHTLGPWKAALDFRREIKGVELDKVEIWLYGSLSKTGKGHATDKAVQLGLLGLLPDQVDTQGIPVLLDEVKEKQLLTVNTHEIHFNPKKHIVFCNYERPEHPNTLEIKAFSGGELIAMQTYLSIGGGFIQKLGEEQDEVTVSMPFPIDSTKDLVGHIKSTGSTIAGLVLQNELSLRPEIEVKNKISDIYESMKQCIFKGCTTDGILPGGLNVKRRAKLLCDDLLGGQQFSSFDEMKTLIGKTPNNFNSVNKWVSCLALAVNEENAAMGRVVTSPTNGAAGVIPAVLFYYCFFCDKTIEDDIVTFFCTSGEIGSLFKKGATISAAVGGCQAEIGVSSAMAAAGLTEVLGGSPSQVLMAAEIAMEHHLGLTCDPVGGLVQIPCIERNAMGAIKAITASNLALSGNPTYAKVDLDTVIKTMWDTALAMNKQFKETSEGGLAFNIPVISPEC